MTPASQLALFDFDKTLVSRDSFRLFGNLGAQSAVRRATLLAYAVLAKLGTFDNRRYKELVLDAVWCGRDQEEQQLLLDTLNSAMGDLAIDSAWERLHQHLGQQDGVAVLSASPEFYLAPYLASVSSEIEVHGSQVVVGEDGVHVDNLYRERKAARARQVIERRRPERVVVYTDHRDDIALMSLADEVVLVRPTGATLSAVRNAGISFETLP
ncbi:MAG: phosphoserine phosphatase [Myxococcota bacterium]|jgi:phosphoserine phosphatase